MYYFSTAIQIILIIILVCICIWLYKLNNATNLITRITRFSAVSIEDNTISFFDKFNAWYRKTVNSLSKILRHSKLITRYCKKYEIYIDQTKQIRTNAIDFLSNRILICTFAIIITIISNVLRSHHTTVFQMLVVCIVGFNISEVFLYINRKKQTKQIETDLLKAVIIMNNAFKSGKSIMQAIELVSTELTGPISDEYKKMYIDLSYGLELELVFDRFAKRVKLEEVRYMSSSLVILNKTGGNLVKIFSSIEKGFFNRKKLQDELRSSTALSDMVFRILIVIPFMIFIMIYIFNNKYFDPLINTGIGKIVLALITVIYISYILIVNRIMKIKE